MKGKVRRAQPPQHPGEQEQTLSPLCQQRALWLCQGHRLTAQAKSWRERQRDQEPIPQLSSNSIL